MPWKKQTVSLPVPESVGESFASDFRSSFSNYNIEVPEEISFENTTPDDFKDRFWEFHAEEGRPPKELVRRFKGKIKSSKTASRNLNEAKERLQAKKEKNLNNK